MLEYASLSLEWSIYPLALGTHHPFYYLNQPTGRAVRYSSSKLYRLSIKISRNMKKFGNNTQSAPENTRRALSKDHSPDRGMLAAPPLVPLGHLDDPARAPVSIGRNENASSISPSYRQVPAHQNQSCDNSDRDLSILRIPELLADDQSNIADNPVHGELLKPDLLAPEALDSATGSQAIRRVFKRASFRGWECCICKGLNKGTSQCQGKDCPVGNPHEKCDDCVDNPKF